jgi:hypothetical protein
MLPGGRVAVIEHVLGENRERGPALRALETASGQDRPIFAPARSRSQGPLSDQVADARTRAANGAVGSTPAARSQSRERPLSLRVFGRLPCAGASGCTEAGVRKASKEETAGSFAFGGGVGAYGDLMRGVDSPGRFRRGTLGE